MFGIESPPKLEEVVDAHRLAAEDAAHTSASVRSGRCGALRNVRSGPEPTAPAGARRSILPPFVSGSAGMANYRGNHSAGQLDCAKSRIVDRRTGLQHT